MTEIPTQVLRLIGLAGMAVYGFSALAAGGVNWLGVAGLATAVGCLQYWLIQKARGGLQAEIWAEGFMFVCPRCQSDRLIHKKVFLGTALPEKERFDCRPFCPACQCEVGTWEQVEKERTRQWEALTEAIGAYYEDQADGEHAHE